MWGKWKLNILWPLFYSVVIICIAGCVYFCWVATASDAQGGIVWLIGGPIIVGLDLFLVLVTREAAQAQSSSIKKGAVYLVTLSFVGLHWILGASLSLGIFELVYHKSPMQYAHDYRGPETNIFLDPGMEAKFDKNRFRVLPCDIIQQQKAYSWDVGNDYSKFNIFFKNTAEEVQYVSWLSSWLQEGPCLSVSPGETIRVLQEGANALVIRNEKKQCKFVIALTFKYRPPDQFLKYPGNN